ncbi:MAG TPA: acyltransferase domain-containing protein [Thermoanaerobaculia bacterium]|nr:acyltransferase domain-containing protein [Thermoanaerobaculia bacterium]
MERPPAPLVQPPARPYRLLVLSAPDEAALDRTAAELADQLAAHPEIDLADVASTLQANGGAAGHRRMLVCREREEAVAALRGGSGPVRVWNGAPAEPPPVSFLFSGVGDHYAGMTRGLYAAEPVFRREIDRCAERLAPWLEVDLRDLLYPSPSTSLEPVSPVSPVARPSLRDLLGRTAVPVPSAGPLDRTRHLHPAMFAVEYALARLWMSWGIVPGSLLGYSVGEYVAACLAGVFSLEAALHLVAFRARAVDALPPGAMLSIFLPASEVAPLLGPELSLAAVNGPTLSVVAGSPAAVAALEEKLRRQRVSSRRLAAGHAFHSAQLDPAVPALVREAATLDLRPPAIPLVSNVTGTWMTAEEATDPGYWARHMCRTVRFAAGLETLGAEAPRALVEIGPGNTLGSMALQPGLANPPRLAVPSLPHARDPESDLATMATALGKLWLAGVEPDWAAYQHRARRGPFP